MKVKIKTILINAILKNKKLIKNKKFLITGCSSGLGYSLVKQLSLFNNKIYCLGRKKIKGKNIKFTTCNLKNLKSIKKNLKKLIDTKKIDYVILNAGILGKIERIQKVNSSELEEIFRINFFANKEIIDFLINKKIKTNLVVAISSGAALSPKVGWYLYCSSKSALKFLIESYAEEFPNRKFINISPGLIKTKMQDQICKINEKKIPSVKKFKKLNENNLVPMPDEVAKNILKTLSKLKNKKNGSYLDIRNK